MSQRRHPTAIIDPAAAVHDTVEVGPYAIIEGDTTIGAGTVIGPHVWVRSGTTMGTENHMHYGAVVGHWPQDTAFDPQSSSAVRMGHRNQIREYVTIHRGTKPDTETCIGDDCLLMGASHVGHNCHVGNGVTIANGTVLAGHVRIDDGAFISGLCAVHQFARIGRLAMIGGITAVVQDVCPFFMVAERNQMVGTNVVGMRRAGLSQAARTEIKEAYKLIYRNGLSLVSALDRIEKRSRTSEAQEIVDFARASTRGLAATSNRYTSNISNYN